jgi:ABC-type glycerol-3-phosphate transport system permease component
MSGRRPAWAGRQRRRYRWISLLGGMLIVVMTYFPIIFVVSNSLKTGQNIFSGGVFSLFTQFDYQNYGTAWAGVSRPLVNTVIVAAVSIVLGVTAAALGAYAFSQLRFRGKELLFLAYIGLLLIPSTLTLIPLFLTIQKLHFFNTWWALILPYAATAQPLLVLIFRGFSTRSRASCWKAPASTAAPNSRCWRGLSPR